MKKTKLPKAARRAIKLFLHKQAVQQLEAMSAYMNANYKSREKMLYQRFSYSWIAIILTIVVVAIVGNNLARNIALPICISLWSILCIALYAMRVRFTAKERYYEQQSELVHARWSQQLAAIEL